MTVRFGYRKAMGAKLAAMLAITLSSVGCATGQIRDIQGDIDSVIQIVKARDIDRVHTSLERLGYTGKTFELKAPGAACWPLLNIEQAAGANRSFDRGPTSTASYPWYEISIFATPLGQGDCVERIVFKRNDEIWQKNGVKSWRDIPIAHVDQTISNIEIAITTLANGEIAETVAAMNRSGQGGTEARVRWVAAYPANNEKPYILRLSFDSSVACVPLNLVTKHMAIRRDPDSRGTWYGNGILVKEALNEPGCIDELARTISKT